MITLNILAFFLILAITLSFGAWVAVHIYGVNAEQNERTRRFMRDVDVCDQADMGEQR